MSVKDRVLDEETGQIVNVVRERDTLTGHLREIAVLKQRIESVEKAHQFKKKELQSVKQELKGQYKLLKGENELLKKKVVKLEDENKKLIEKYVQKKEKKERKHGFLDRVDGNGKKG